MICITELIITVIKICIAELMIHSHYDSYNRADDAVIMVCITELMINNHYDLYNSANYSVIMILYKRADDSQSL